MPGSFWSDAFDRRYGRVCGAIRSPASTPGRPGHSSARPGTKFAVGSGARLVTCNDWRSCPRMGLLIPKILPNGVAGATEADHR
jgi:hypothetical protein